MAPNKYSFATVLANVDSESHVDQQSRSRESSAGLHSNHGEQRRPVLDEFSLQAHPNHTVPSNSIPLSGTSSRSSSRSRLIQVAPPKRTKRKPNHIFIPPRFTPGGDEEHEEVPQSTSQSAAAIDDDVLEQNIQQDSDGEDNYANPSYRKFLSDLNDFEHEPEDSDIISIGRPSTAPSVRPTSTYQSAESRLGVKKKVNIPLADFLKEVPEPKTPLSPTPKSPFRSPTAQSATTPMSPVFSLFRAFGRLGPFGRNDSRQDSRKDSSSLSSYHARTASDVPSEDTGRSSWESTPHGLNEKNTYRGIASMDQSRSVIPEENSPVSPRLAVGTEPFLDFGALHGQDSRQSPLNPPAREDVPIFSDFDIQPHEYVEETRPGVDTRHFTDDDFQSEADLPVRTSSNATAKRKTTNMMQEDLDSDHPDAPTDTEASALTDGELSIYDQTPRASRVVAVNDYPTDTETASIHSAQTSVISAVDLSSIPRSNPTAPRHFASDPVMRITSGGRTSSLDSAAPPPISLLRGQEIPKPRRVKSGGFQGRMSLLKRATSKPTVKTAKQSKAEAEADRLERMAELELLTKSVPYEKASRGVMPFTSKTVANTYPIRMSIASDKGLDKIRSKKRQIGMGIREEQVLLGALEDSHWREKERRARLAADAEYLRVMREGSGPEAYGALTEEPLHHLRPLSTIVES